MVFSKPKKYRYLVGEGRAWGFRSLFLLSLGGGVQLTNKSFTFLIIGAITKPSLNTKRCWCDAWMTLLSYCPSPLPTFYILLRRGVVKKHYGGKQHVHLRT